MARRRRKSDMGSPNQRTLFDVMDEVNVKKSDEPEPGSLNMGQQIKQMLSNTLKKSAYKRWEIAGRIGDYVGTEITESMLNSWTAESKEGYRFPLEYLPAFCWATGDYDLAEAVVRKCGCYLIKSEEVALLELAKIEEERRHLGQREKEVRKFLNTMRQEGSR